MALSRSIITKAIHHQPPMKAKYNNYLVLRGRAPPRYVSSVHVRTVSNFDGKFFLHRRRYTNAALKNAGKKLMWGRHPGTQLQDIICCNQLGEAHKLSDLALLQTPCHYWVWGEGWEVLRHICDVNDMRLLSICACGMRVLINHKKRAKNWPLAMQRPSTELQS